MKYGINNTRYVKDIIGKRIKEARTNMIISNGKNRGMSRQMFVDELSKNEKAPLRNGEKDSVSVDRLKQWEYGNNPIELEWIPAICEVLGCDVGYLFGEYEELTKEAADVCKETGLSSCAVEVLQSLKRRAQSSILVSNVLETLTLLLENTDERKPEIEIIPLLEYISAYLNCDPDDGRIVSVEMDGSVSIFENCDAFENSPGEAVSGDYMRQIVKTRLEQRVMDELKALWNEKNRESRKDFIKRITENRKAATSD